MSVYEMTHKGAWFQWSALDPTEKVLVAVSCIAAVPSGVVAGIWLGGHGYVLGEALASGSTSPAAPSSAALYQTDFFAVLVALAVAGSVISALCWWRLSVRQDELFNRVQNYALGQAAAWAFAGAALWWMMSLPGWVGELQLGWFVTLTPLLVFLFWGLAVRRWA
jgi:hypothetical protein